MPNIYHNMLQRLRNIYDEDEARAVAFLVLEDAFGVSRTDVYADKVKDFSPQESVLLENIVQRLLNGEPIQYILGRARFCGRDFRVTPHTLIPRPETEELVGIIEHRFQPASILDVGTGSGCIAVSLKLSFPDAYVEAWDISSEALAVAQDNARSLDAKVKRRIWKRACWSMSLIRHSSFPMTIRSFSTAPFAVLPATETSRLLPSRQIVPMPITWQPFSSAKVFRVPMSSATSSETNALLLFFERFSYIIARS